MREVSGSEAGSLDIKFFWVERPCDWQGLCVERGLFGMHASKQTIEEDRLLL